MILALIPITVFSSCLTLPIQHFSKNLNHVKRETSTGDSTYVLDKLSSTARVITAISMLNGLSDGSIETDNVISELLNLGSTDLKSLEDFDKTKVDKFVEKLASFDEKLDISAKTLEKELNDYRKTVELWSSVGDYKTLPDDATYKKLDGIKSLDLTNLKSLPIAVSLDLLEKFSTLDGGQVQSLQKSLVDMIAKLKGTEKSIDFKRTLEILSRLTPFEPISQSFGLLGELIGYSFDPRRKQVEIDQMVANFKNVKNLISSAIVAPLGLMSAIITSRFLYASTTRVHTSGFVNGFTDLRKIAADLKDEWLLKNVHPTTKIVGIEKLVQLEASMKTVDDQWKSIATEDVYISVRKIKSVHDRLAALQTEVTKANIEAVLNSMETCAGTRLNKGILMKLVSVAKSSSELNRRLSALHLIHFTIDRDKMESRVNSLSPETSSKDVQEIKSFLKTLGYQLQLVDPETPINVDGLNIADLSEITDFATNVDTADFIEVLDCYKNNWKDDFKNFFQASSASMKIRDLKKDQKMRDNVKTVTLKLSDTAGSLKSIRTAVDKLKDDKSERMKLLAKLRILGVYSEPFGEAVNAIALAKRVSEKSNDFLLFLDHSASLKKESAILLNGEDAMKYWGDVGQTKGDVLTMLTEVNDWLNKIKVPIDAKLVDFSSLFAGLSKIKDFNLKTDDRLFALQLISEHAVASEHIDLIDNSKKTLLDLSKLDTTFSRFESSVQSMKKALSDVSELLAKNHYHLKPDEPIPEASNVTTPTEEVSAPTESLSGTMILLIILGIFFVFCCLPALILNGLMEFGIV